MANFLKKYFPHSIWWVPSTYQMSHYVFLKLQYVLHQGESMVKHTKKVDEKISSFKISIFSQKQKKIYSNFT
jgi:hypothetical protein